MADTLETPKTSEAGKTGKFAALRARLGAAASKLLFAEGSTFAPQQQPVVPERPVVSGAGQTPVEPVVTTPGLRPAFKPSAADEMGVIWGAGRNFPVAGAGPAILGAPNGGYSRGGPDVGQRATLFDDGGNVPAANPGVVIEHPDDITRAYPGQRPRPADTAGVIATGASAPYTVQDFPRGEHGPAVVGRSDDGYPPASSAPYAPPEGLFPPDSNAQPPAGNR